MVILCVCMGKTADKRVLVASAHTLMVSQVALCVRVRVGVRREWSAHAEGFWRKDKTTLLSPYLLIHPAPICMPDPDFFPY